MASNGKFALKYEQFDIRAKSGNELNLYVEIPRTTGINILLAIYLSTVLEIFSVNIRFWPN